MSFGNFLQLGMYYYTQVQEHFHHPQNLSSVHLLSASALSPSPRQMLICLQFLF